MEKRKGAISRARTSDRKPDARDFKVDGNCRPTALPLSPFKYAPNLEPSSPVESSLLPRDEFLRNSTLMIPPFRRFLSPIRSIDRNSVAWKRGEEREDKPRAFLPALLEIVPAWKLASLITRLSPSPDSLLSLNSRFRSLERRGVIIFLFFLIPILTTIDGRRFHYVSTRAFENSRMSSFVSSFLEFGGTITSG